MKLHPQSGAKNRSKRSTKPTGASSSGALAEGAERSRESDGVFGIPTAPEPFGSTKRVDVVLLDVQGDNPTARRLRTSGPSLGPHFLPPMSPLASIKLRVHKLKATTS